MSHELAISAAGAVTSVGPTAAATAAACRAGLARSRPLTHYRSGAVDEEGNPPSGRPVSGLTDGFAQFGLWVRLAQLAIDDLRRSGLAESDAFWRQTALVACLPELELPRFGLPRTDVPGLLRTGFLEPVQAACRLSLDPKNFHAAFGNCAAARAIATAQQSLHADKNLQHVLLLGVDSLCDAQSLAWLQAADRLKTRDLGAGTIPGEGGAALLLRRGAPKSAAGLAGLGEPAIAAGTPADAPPTVGRRLAEVVARAAASGTGSAGGAGTLDVFVDLNGEPWRAEIFGHALVHLQQLPGFADHSHVFPAASLGDTGAASGALAAVLATRAFARGYASGRTAIVAAIGDDRTVAAFAITAPRSD